MLNMPFVRQKIRRAVIFDLDETLVKSKKPTRDPLHRTLYGELQEIDPQGYNDFEKFKEATERLNTIHMGNAIGWQKLLGLPESWTHGVYEKAAVPMAEAVCRDCPPDSHIINWLESRRDEGMDMFLLTQSTKTYCDIVLPHLGLDHIFGPDRVLHVGWAGYKLKTEESVYKKLHEINAVRHADLRDMVDDNQHNLRAAHQFGSCRTWLNGGELTEDMRPYVFQHHPHIHQTLGALAA